MAKINKTCGGKLEETPTREALGLMGTQYSFQLFDHIAHRQTAQALAVLKAADSASLDLGSLLEEAATHFRNALVLREVKDEAEACRLTELLPKEYARIQECGKNLSVAALSEIYRALTAAVREMSRNLDSLSLAEIAILDCSSRAEWLSPSELLGLLGSEARAKTESGTPSPAAKRPVPTATTTQTENIDLQPLARIVTIVEKKSISLAARLKNACFDQFDAQLIQFSDVPANKLLTQMNPQDAAIFMEALRECGFEKALLKGIDLGQKSKPAPLQQKSTLSKDAKLAETSAKTQKVLLEDYRDLDVFAPVSQNQERPNSLASMERQQKVTDFKERESRLKNSDPIKRLSEVASVEIHPIDPREPH